MAVYIGRSVNSGPSDQTDLKGWCRCNLGGGGEPTFKAEADRWTQRLGGLGVGPPSPTWQPIRVYFGGEPPRVF